MPFVVMSLDEMYKEVLAWDLYIMLTSRAMYQLRDVPVRFSSVDEYLDVFEPLLLEECRAQTLRSLYEVGADAKDHHLTLKAVEPLEPFRLLHFESPNVVGEKTVFFDTDLVFVSHEPLDLSEEELEGGGSKPVGQQFHALALVVNSASQAPGTLSLKVYLPEEPTARLPPSQHKRLQLLRKVMVPASGAWYVRKLGNMVTINREFQALYSLRELTLASMLLAPGALDGNAPPPSLQPPPTLLKAIKETHNPSQLEAIRTCLCGRGVTLIQGPPGTGKTKTILGILSVLLASHSSQSKHNARAMSVPGGGPPPAWPFEPTPERMPEQIASALLKSAPWLSVARPSAPSHQISSKAAARPEVDADGSELRSTAEAASRAANKRAAPPPVVPAVSLDSAEANVGKAMEAAPTAAPAAPAAPVVIPLLPPHPFPRAASTDRQVQLGRAIAEVPPKHVLVCAPSNAAIDEIVSRLLRESRPDLPPGYLSPCVRLTAVSLERVRAAWEQGTRARACSTSGASPTCRTSCALAPTSRSR